MSESKARLERNARWLAAECDRLESDVVFLLQILVDIEHDIPVANIDWQGRQFPERVWRRITVPG